MTHFIILLISVDVVRIATHADDKLWHTKLNIWEIDGITLAFIGLVLLVSSITYRFIEVPPRARAKHWVSSWKAAEPEGTIGSP
jgi:peptidoglycan/LPS O-acetylase OafA/YrhL